MIPEEPTVDNIGPVLEALELYIFVDSVTGQDCGEVIKWYDDLWPSYENARY